MKEKSLMMMSWKEMKEKYGNGVALLILAGVCSISFLAGKALGHGVIMLRDKCKENEKTE